MRVSRNHRLISTLLFGTAVLLFGSLIQAADTPDESTAKPPEKAEAAPEKPATLEDAEKALDGEKFDDAVKLCEALLDRDPRNGNALALRGTARLYLDQEDLAKADLDEALRLDSKNARALYGLAYCYADKQPNRALKYINNALAVEPTREEALLVRLGLYVQRKDWDKAATDCEQLRKQCPNDSLYYYLDAFVRHFLQDGDAALADLDKAVEIDSYAAYYELRALFRAQHGDMESALADFREFRRRQDDDVPEKFATKKKWSIPFEGEDAVAFANLAVLDDPDDAQAYVARSKAEYDVGRLDASFADATKAQELRANLVGPYAVRAAILADRNNLPAALEELEKGLQTIPGDLYLQWMRAKARNAMGDFDHAKAEIEAVIRLNPTYATIYVEWGDDLARQNQFDEALKIYNRVLELVPLNPEATLRRGALHVQRSEWSEAAEDFEKYVVLRPDDAEGHQWLAGVYSRQENKEEVRKNVDLILEIDPENADALLWRAKIFRFEDRYQEALADANDYVKLKPNDDEGLRERAAIHYNEGNWDAARADLDDAVKSNSDNGENYFYRGFAKYGHALWLADAYKTQRTKRIEDQAVNSARPSAAESPALDHSIVKNIGSASQTEDSTISGDVSNVKTSPPSTTQGWLESAVPDPLKSTLEEARRGNEAVKSHFKEALADLDEAVRLDPDNTRYHETRAKICADLHDDDAALVSLDALIRLDPKNVDATLQRGLIRVDKKRYDDALADFDKVSELDPKNQTVYYYRASAYRQKGDSEKADAELAKARELLDKR